MLGATQKVTLYSLVLPNDPKVTAIELVTRSRLDAWLHYESRTRIDMLIERHGYAHREQVAGWKQCIDSNGNETIVFHTYANKAALTFNLVKSEVDGYEDA